MKKYFYIAVAIVASYLIIEKTIDIQYGLISELKNKISKEKKDKIKEIFFPYKNQKILKKKIEELNLIILSQNIAIKRTKNLLDDSNKFIEGMIYDYGIKFVKNEKSNKINIDNKRYILEKFTTNLLRFGKNYKAKGTSYIDYVNNNLVLSSATGTFGYVNFSEFSKNEFVMNPIYTNIKEIIKDEEFYKTSFKGIKDILIHNNKIYVSYSNKLRDNCYNTSIIAADFNFDKLVFENFFTPSICLKSGQATQAGGRMKPYKNNEILFSIGNYGYKEHAQDKKSIFGKIISIDLNSSEYKIISMGHRNVQGLYYEKDYNYIISTEHGPTGGDEVNIINDFKTTPNYGWPISSYGDMYTKYEVDNFKKKNPFKSHKKHGFIEPIKYFVPSIGISEIVKVNLPITKNNYENYFVASMGWNEKEGDKSIYHLVLNSEKKIIKYESYFIDERIRDMIFVKELNKVFLFLETTASIGVLSLEP